MGGSFLASTGGPFLPSGEAKDIIAARRRFEVISKRAELSAQINEKVQAKHKRILELRKELKAFARGTPQHAAIQSELDQVRKEMHEATARSDRLEKEWDAADRLGDAHL